MSAVIGVILGVIALAAALILALRRLAVRRDAQALRIREAELRRYNMTPDFRGTKSIYPEKRR